jgi:hypothetical protein
MAAELRARGCSPAVETCWVRPQAAAIGALHAALGVVGSLLTAAAAAAGAAVLAAVLASQLCGLYGVTPPLALVLRRRATQNVVAAGPYAPGAPVRLVLTAPLDAPRAGTVTRSPWSTGWAALSRRLGGRLPAPEGVLALLVAGLLALAAVRAAAGGSHGLAVAGLVLTLPLLLAFAAYVDLALSDPAPGTAEASTIAALLAVYDRLDRAPPEHLRLEVVLAGAGRVGALGMADFVARRRRAVVPTEVAVIALEPAADDAPAWWTHDGPLLALPAHRQLAALAARAAAADPGSRAHALRGHGRGAALRARAARWPALAIGCPDGACEPEGLRAAIALAADIALALDRELGVQSKNGD